uniref:Uncharacterized protein n=1 Tax=Physcomitrium patens TaxID=3218 RepID=A0A2K1JXS2_PHYPA|nr:hypothetical protein PHYPA_013444 [Physcomitrium patens]
MLSRSVTQCGVSKGSAAGSWKCRSCAWCVTRCDLCALCSLRCCCQVRLIGDSRLQLSFPYVAIEVGLCRWMSGIADVKITVC